MIFALIERWAHFIILQWGWRRNLLAFLAGGLTTLALPPYGLWPVIFITFPVLVWLLDGLVASGSRRSFKSLMASSLTGFFFGFGYFLFGLWWIGNAFLVDAGVFKWLLPVAVIALPLALALFYAAAFFFAAFVWGSHPFRIFGLAASFAGMEWVRSTVLTGFPWNAVGYTLASNEALAQTASITGIAGLSFLAVLVGSAPAMLVHPEANWRRWLIPVFALSALLTQFVYGTHRLNTAENDFVPGVRLRIMQPNIPQDEKFRPEAKDEILATYERLSKLRGENGIELSDVSHLIWPESAFPFILSKDKDAQNRIGQLLPFGVTLLTGAARSEPVSADSKQTKVYNSIHAIADDGSIIYSYDKVHLVPFGEYLPFQEALESIGLRQLTRLRGGFTAGKSLETMTVPRAPMMSPLICYEIIFSGNVARRDDRPHWILNVTNDGWFGNSPGPYQHLQQARLRAIEEGLSVVRAANTGISAVIDPYGRIIRGLKLGQEGILDAPLPRMAAKTLFIRYGELIFFLGAAFSYLLAALSRRIWR